MRLRLTLYLTKTSQYQYYAFQAVLKRTTVVLSAQHDKQNNIKIHIYVYIY